MMAIAIPDVISHDAAIVWIEGGSNGPDTGPAGPEDQLVKLTVTMARETGAVGAYIRQVPNQSMVFTASYLTCVYHLFDRILLSSTASNSIDCS